MSALLIVHRDDVGRTMAIPFVYKDGQMMDILDTVADYLASAGLVDDFREGIMADRLRIILQQRAQIRELSERIKAQDADLAALGLGAPIGAM